MKQHPEWKIEIASDYEPHTFKNPAGYSSYAFRQADIQWLTAVSSAIQWMQDQQREDRRNPHEVGADRLQQLERV